MDSFQVCLPSNASAKIFPNNTASNYETELNTPLHLEGPWEVALVDITYPVTWNNLSKPIRVSVVVATELDGKTFVHLDVSFTIKPQFFPSTIVMCERINNLWIQACKPVLRARNAQVQDPFDILHMQYDEIEDRITINSILVDLLDLKKFPYTKLFILYDNNSLEQMFGIFSNNKFKFDDHTEMSGFFVNHNENRIGERAPKLETYPLMFVYSDIIQYQYIGDVKAPILGVLPVRGEQGEQAYWSCNPLTFMAISKSHIPTIQVRLCTETGETFPIVGNGKVIARLNFRRRLV